MLSLHRLLSSHQLPISVVAVIVAAFAVVEGVFFELSHRHGSGLLFIVEMKIGFVACICSEVSLLHLCWLSLFAVDHLLMQLVLA